MVTPERDGLSERVRGWIRRRLGIPYRFHGGFGVALLASLLAVGLATVPVILLWEDHEYSPQVGVTTATLIAIVWYTFFTYWAANRRDPGYAIVDLERDRERLIPQVHNPTRRTLTVRLVMRVWVDEHEVPQGSFYRGEDQFVLPPQETFKGSISLWDEISIGLDEIGQPVIEQGWIRVKLIAQWVDDLEERGKADPRYFRAPFDAETEVVSVVSDENIEHWFPELVG